MKISQKNNVLGLTSAEKTVFECLSSNPLLPADITRKISLPRTTLLRTLKALQNRGLVESEKIGNRNGWKRVAQGMIERNLLMGAESIGISIAGLEVPGFKLLRGTNELTAEFW